MNVNGPVIIIEDDPDDQFLFAEAFKSLNYKNKLIFFINGDEAFEYLNRKDVVPFLIMSDINMPKISGFELRKQIQTNEALVTKCIPYLFFTTASDQKSVIDAYSMSVQGFFVKQNSVIELEKTLSVIMQYWVRCVAPNDV
ncbi:MAG: response regulator [Bacteroidetes bacterium]|nr:response regulator [Bacteroidota bacterium]